MLKEDSEAMSEENGCMFSYDADHFVICLQKGTESEFDRKLKSCWEEKVAKNCFRYILEDLETRYIPGKYSFVAQLNIKRAVERRKPQFVSDVIMPFEPEKFHFGKIDKKEFLFCLLPKHWEQGNSFQNLKMSERHTLIINISPLEYCNSLLVPSLESFYPQVLNLDGLRLAIETILISHDPTLRIGMNSLGAYASVNHLHFHIYYLKEILYLQYAPVKHLIGECYEIEDFPSEGFAFQLLETEKVLSTARSIMKLIHYLQEERIAHNIFITRGKTFTNSNSNKKDVFDAVRIFVWARKSSFGSKDDMAFNPALCELAGHLLIKERNSFNTLTEEDVICILKDICHDTYQKVRSNIKPIFINQV